MTFQVAVNERQGLAHGYDLEVWQHARLQQYALTAFESMQSEPVHKIGGLAITLGIAMSADSEASIALFKRSDGQTSTRLPASSN
jgi:hypothetical protein